MGPINEVGVYYKKGDLWADLAPEVANFKTGGVLKTIGTAGIVKGDVNGHINGPHSNTQLKTPVKILIYTPEGTAITEYQLLRLREQKGSREFRTVTGGVLHVSGGATRDLIPFESKKIAARTYQIVLPSLGAGNFGILPPAGGDSTSVSPGGSPSGRSPPSPSPSNPGAASSTPLRSVLASSSLTSTRPTPESPSGNGALVRPVEVSWS